MITTNQLKELQKNISPDVAALNQDIFAEEVTYATRPSAPQVTASEHDEQVTLFDMADRHSGQYPELSLLYAIPNGGDRHPAVAAKLKAEGVRAGVPDICLPVPRHGYCGFYGELKVGRNKPSDDQSRWLYALEKQGCYCTVQWGHEAMWEQLLSYVQLPPPADWTAVSRQMAKINVTLRLIAKDNPDTAPLLRQWEELVALL